MRAVAVYPAARRVAVTDVPEPERAGATEVLLRVRAVGVCGTDKEIGRFQYGTPPPGRDRLIVGHECAAEVVEVGEAVTRVRPGDLVVPTVRRPCGRADCRACPHGAPDFCTTGAYTERGIKSADGFLCEWVVEEEGYLHPVAPELGDLAVLVEPLTIAEKALRQVEAIQQRLGYPAPAAGPGAGGQALVLGAGPVGLLGALRLVHAGYRTHVYSRERPDGPKAAVARGAGAVYWSAAEHPLEDLGRRLGPVDLIYEAVGASQVAFEALPLLGPNGIFVFTGVPGRKCPIQIQGDRIMRRLVLHNQVVLGTVNAGGDAFERAGAHLAGFLAERPDAVRSIITGTFPPEAYGALTTGPAGGIKNVIRPA